MSISWDELQSIELAAALLSPDSEDSSSSDDMDESTGAGAVSPSEKSEVGDWFPDEFDVAVATEADLEGPEAGYGCGEAGVEVRPSGGSVNSYRAGARRPLVFNIDDILQPRNQEEEEDSDLMEEEEGSDLEEEEEDGDYISLTALNVEYANHLKTILVNLQVELARNQYRQRQIEEEISELETEEGEVVQQHPAQRFLKKLYAAPYFKDQNGFQPPANTDTITKRFTKELPVWLSLHPKKFSEEDQAKLKVSVKQEAVRMRKEKLQQEIDKLPPSSLDPDFMEGTFSERLADLTRELRDVENSAEEDLLGNRLEKYDWERISVQSVHSATVCRLQWQNKLHPAINNTDFTAEEDRKLQDLAEQFDCRNWDTIARRMQTGRTAIACFTRYKTHLNTVFNNRPWSKDEDKRLIELVRLCRYSQLVNWQKVAFYMENRTKEQCSSRFSFSLRDNLRLGQFSDVEDILLLVGVLKHQDQWTKITDIIPSRNSRQLHSRFRHFFRGEKAAWTKEEDVVLLEEVQKLGMSDWAKISKELSSRGVERNRAQCRQRIRQIWNKFQKTEGEITSWGQVLQYRDGPTLAQRRLHSLKKSLERHYSQWLEGEGAINTATMTEDNKIELIAGISFSPRGLSLFTRHLQQKLPARGEKVRRTLTKEKKLFDFMEDSESEEEDADDVDDFVGQDSLEEMGLKKEESD